MIKAKKKFGQNFLIDEVIKNRIIQSMSNQENDTVVEIGPGLGDLTIKLLDRCEHLVAFEIDLELCAHLQEKFKKALATDQLELICNDVLKEWGNNSLVKQKYHLVANLPYYVATNIILKALEDPLCRSILVMVQKEVAERFSASPGDKDFSSISILAKSIGNVEFLFDVGAECFNPPPNVTSAVMRITKHSKFVKAVGSSDFLFESEDDFSKFKIFLKAAFSAPRKIVLKNLQSLGNKEQLKDLFLQLKIKETLRPHQLSVEQYHQLFQKIG